ncbi:MAG: UDP-N-acetylmuramoyl-L-alanyl-D-glutamate--2,6-diaminopimelate ligase [Solirubrobacterales bacterium]
MKLSDLLVGFDYEVLQGNPETDVTGLEYDSRKVESGDVFICIPGFKTDGHLYAPQACERGAQALIVERRIELPPDITAVLVKNVRQALPVLASRFFERPSSHLRVIGVTGTNGKTTTTHLIKAILEEAGHRVGLLGTLYADWNGQQDKISNTTPESVELERFMKRVLDDGGKYVVMEVSSHALDLGRVAEIDFDVAVFTNLTQDHLDYHVSLENYREAKAILFDNLVPAPHHFAVLNADDETSHVFAARTRAEWLSFGIHQTADVRAVDAKIGATGSTFTAVFGQGRMEIQLKLAGLFSIYNALAAIAFGLREGIEPEVITRALEKVKGVPGRFESIDDGQEYAVIVDYAHTPDGLENILRTAKQIAKRRIITVFGCGGDRDRTKRPIMGGISGQYSDFTIVTSDNPRSEEPLAIIEEILVGLREQKDAHYAVVPDRREAIRHAVHLAAKDDLVIIAGKGHEDYQIVKGQILPFDDREVARDCIREKEEHDRNLD